MVTVKSKVATIFSLVSQNITNQYIIMIDDDSLVTVKSLDIIICSIRLNGAYF